MSELGNRVYVVSDESVLPLEAEFPSATVKDGGTTPMDFDNQEVLAEHHLVVSLFVENLRDVEAPVLGDVATPGLQRLTGACLAALKDQTLDQPVLAIVRATDIGGTEIFLTPDGAREITRKTVTWLYRQKPSI
jgi:hypothetical protein